jgi:tetratricopeptide (TPR) repeat protein
VIVDLYLRRGHAFELNAQDAEALRNYEALEAWAAAHGQRAAQLAGLNARATIYVKPSVEMNLPLGYSLSQQALALARDLGDPAAEAKVEWNLLQYYLGDGNMTEALVHGEQALALARAHNLREQEAYVLTDLYKGYYQVGQLQRAQAAIETARAIWRDLGVLNMLADNLASTAMTNVIGGQYEEALALSDEALRISRTIGNVWNQSYALYTVDLVHFDRGDFEQALAVTQECRRLAAQAGFAEGRNQADFDLTMIYAYLGAFERAFETARSLEARGAGMHTSPHWTALIAFLHLRAGRPAEAQAMLTAAAIPEDEAELQTWFPLTYLFIEELRAELALVTGEYERVLAITGSLVPYLERIGVRVLRDDAVYLRGRALRALGRHAEARQVLTTARASCEALGSRRLLWLILAELAALASDDGDEMAAEALRGQAVDIIDYIAEHAGAADLRATFLNRPEVQAVLGQAQDQTPPGP